MLRRLFDFQILPVFLHQQICDRSMPSGPAKAARLPPPFPSFPSLLLVCTLWRGAEPTPGNGQMRNTLNAGPSLNLFSDLDKGAQIFQSASRSQRHGFGGGENMKRRQEAMNFCGPAQTWTSPAAARRSNLFLSTRRPGALWFPAQWLHFEGLCLYLPAGDFALW